LVGNFDKLRSEGYIDCLEASAHKPTCGYKALDHLWAKGIETVIDCEIPDMNWTPGSMRAGVVWALENLGSDHLPVSTTIEIKCVE
jgi:hypothetical protein